MKNSLTCNETDTNTPNDILVGFNTCNNAKGLMNQEDITEIHKVKIKLFNFILKTVFCIILDIFCCFYECNSKS